MSQNAVDFLPEDYVEKRAAHRSAILFIGLFIAVMAGIVAAYLIPERRRLEVMAERNQVNHDFEEAGRQLAQLQEMDHEKQTMIGKAEVTAYLLEKVPRSVLLAEFTRMLPKGASLLTVELRSKDLPQTHTQTKLDDAKAQQDKANGTAESAPPPEREVTITITGMAPSDGHVAAFIAALSKNPLLCDVNLLFSEEYKFNETTLRRFKVEMKVNPDADVRSGELPASKG
jgi:Tfp pilus assembly protein PilN